MGKAARAIIIEGDKILVMRRNKQGSEYYTLVGGRVQPSETIEQSLVREVKEETGLTITKARHVFTEKHPEPYNEQYIFLCEVAPHESVAIQAASEEALMNIIDINVHTPLWVELTWFSKLPFVTMQLQTAIVQGLKKGFPSEPATL